jgi:hypothetical protein
MTTHPKSEEDLRSLDRTERQVELDAIALYGNSQEFPPVANAYVHPEEPATEPNPSSPEDVG